MKKNCKIHLWLDEELKQIVQRQADEEGIPFSEFCRRKFKENERIVKMEMMLEKILEIVKNRR
jgi:hypothetical protein